MSIAARVEKRERSMAELIVVIVLFSLLMATFISSFMTQKEQISQAGFERLADNFFSKVNVVRSQWFMDQKPNVVILSELGSNKNERISINQWGWLDVNNDFLACHAIWKLALDAPMEFMKSPVSAVEIKSASGQQGRVCRYGIDNGHFFEYYSASGKVIK